MRRRIFLYSNHVSEGMSEPVKNPFDQILDAIRVIVAEEIAKALDNGRTEKLFVFHERGGSKDRVSGIVVSIEGAGWVRTLPDARSLSVFLHGRHRSDHRGVEKRERRLTSPAACVKLLLEKGEATQ